MQFADVVIAACMRCLTLYLVLNPRINYTVLLHDYADDEDLVDYFETLVEDLHTHYQRHYYVSTQDFIAEQIELSQMALSSSSRNQLFALKVNFTARYWKKECLNRDELEEYFNVEQEHFETCKPLEWWVGCHAQFPNLFRLAHDILTIPGMFLIFLLFRV